MVRLNVHCDHTITIIKLMIIEISIDDHRKRTNTRLKMEIIIMLTFLKVVIVLMSIIILIVITIVFIISIIMKLYFLVWLTSSFAPSLISLNRLAWSSSSWFRGIELTPPVPFVLLLFTLPLPLLLAVYYWPIFSKDSLLMSNFFSFFC